MIKKHPLAKTSDYKKDELYQLQISNPSNKKCADCLRNMTNYIDTIYGCFLCSNCAGIHRNLGSSISRIKSISFDKFTNDEITFIKNIDGNDKFNETYEFHCVDKKTNMTDQEIKQFIVKKYELKKYFGMKKKDYSPDIKEKKKDILLVDLS